MRSQVQVLAGPHSISAGHSAAGSEPGTPAARLGRAGAARPSPPAHHRPCRTPHAGGRPHDHHPPWSPPSPTAATRPLRQPRAAACSRAHHAAASDGAPYTGLACLVAQPVKRGRPPSPHLARVRHRPPLTAATSAASPARPPIEPLQDVAAHRDSTRSCGDGCPPPRPGPHRRRLRGTRWTRPDGRRRTAAGWTPDGRTPDGLDTRRPDTGRPDTGRPDRRTRTTEPLSGHHMVDADGDRRRGRHPGLADQGDGPRPRRPGQATVIRGSDSPATAVCMKRPSLLPSLRESQVPSDGVPASSCTGRAWADAGQGLRRIARGEAVVA
jgi:hypothetical protein